MFWVIARASYWHRRQFSVLIARRLQATLSSRPAGLLLMRSRLPCACSRTTLPLTLGMCAYLSKLLFTHNNNNTARFGSVLNAAGKVEMDALIMDGKTLRSGSVAALSGVRNPVTLARRVMDSTPHCLLVGDGAQAFAVEQGIEIVPTESLVTEEAVKQYAEYKQQYKSVVGDLFNDPKGHDTVGAVAYDAAGNIACATSTGGITGKRVGRVGDSPLVGSGGFADNMAGGCSSTGHGESIIPVQLCARAVQSMETGTLPSGQIHTIIHKDVILMMVYFAQMLHSALLSTCGRGSRAGVV